MKKRIFLTGILGLLITFQVMAQSSLTAVIRTEAQVLAQATMNYDAETMFKYSYPKLVEMIGGKTRFIQQFKMSTDNLKSQGIVIKSVVMGEPGTIYTAGTELHALVPQETIIDQKGVEIKSKNYLLAVSSNGGKQWYFINLDSFKEESIRLLFPNFNPQLKIPAKVDPITTIKGN